MRCAPVSFYTIPIYIILAQANKINMTVELVRNNLHFLEAKGLGLSQQEKKECFGRQSKHSFLQSVHTLAVLAVLSNPSPAPVSPKILREHEHFFRLEP